MVVRSWTRGLVRLVVIATTGAGVGCGGPEVTCGPGTEEHSGYCAVIPEPSPHCGEGTSLDIASNTCVPRTACGDGTILDEESGTCVTLTRCGQGTVLDLSTGTCEAVVTCGEGTVLIDGQCYNEAACGVGTVLHEASQACVAVDPCVQGSIYNPVSGLCESQLVCTSNQIDVDGVCYPRGRELAAQATVAEPAGDTNDPRFGGTPESLTLPAEGEAVVFLGRMGRPADQDGNGTLEQDIDVWEFDGLPRQYLRIRVLTDGLPQPAFTLEGPDGYYRESAMGYVVEADRQVILPRPGRYRLTIAPAIFLTAGIAIGGSEARYIGAIDVLPLPEPQPVVPTGSEAEPTGVVTGELRDLNDNYFLVKAGALRPFVTRLTRTEGSGRLAVLGFGTGGQLLVDRTFDEDEAPWVGGWSPLPDDVHLMVDWVNSRSTEGRFEVQWEFVPLAQTAPFSGTGPVVTEAADIIPGQIQAYTFELVEDAVAELELAASAPLIAPTVLVVGQGVRAASDRGPNLVGYLPAGDYVAFVNHGGLETASNVRWQGFLAAPVPLGTLGEAGGPDHVRWEGETLVEGAGGAERAWATLTVSGDWLLRVEGDVAFGDPELRVFGSDGSLMRAVRGIQTGAIHLNAPHGTRLVLRLSPFVAAGGLSGVVEQWALDFSVVPQVVLKESEANDTFGDADHLDLDRPVTGVLYETAVAYDDRQRDIFAISVPELPGEGTALRLSFENLDADPTLFDSGATGVRVFGPDQLPLAVIPGQEGPVSGIVAPRSEIWIPAASVVVPTFFELTEWRVEEVARYVVSATLTTDLFEAEPNEDATQATELGALPARRVGMWNSNGDVADFYRFTLPGDLPDDLSLVARLFNLEDAGRFVLTLLDDAGGLVAVRAGPAAPIQVRGLSAGDYLLRVEGPGTGSPPYELTVDFGGRHEVEPNDTGDQATRLGTVGAGAPLSMGGVAVRNTPDVFAVSLGEPLGASESLVVEVGNRADTTDLTVTLFDGADPAVALPLASDAGAVARVIARPAGTGPFALVVEGRDDPYVVMAHRGGASELEPNDQLSQLSPLQLSVTTLGAVALGDTDLYVFELPAALGGDELLEVTVYNDSDRTPVTVDLIDFLTRTTIASDQGALVRLAMAGLSAGKLILRVAQPEGHATRSDTYGVRVRTVVPPGGSGS